MRMIYYNGQCVHTYHQEDTAHQRVCWVGVYTQGWATYNQIAEATGMARRTIQYWVEHFRDEGIDGLRDVQRCGPPIKVTDEIRMRICRLRNARTSVTQIAQACQISVSSVRLVLKAREEAIAQKQATMDLPDDQAAESAPGKGDANDMRTEEALPRELPEAIGEEQEDVLSRDRSVDRLLAAAGKIMDARPLFGNAEKAEFAGAFMAVVLLSTHPFLSSALKIFRPFKAAFYGLRTMMVTWVLMAILRIKCCEQIREKDVRSLGRILGLDRVAEGKTIRRKMHELIEQDCSLEWMDELARARVEACEGPVSTVQVDGHVVTYCGEQKVGTVYSARTQRVGKGQTENWVHVPQGGGALFMLTSPFNEGLSSMLEQVVQKACEVSGQEHLHVVFDRGGQSCEKFERLLAAQHDITTYRKGDFEAIGLEQFEKKEVVIGDRRYQYAPYDHDIELPVYEKQVGANGKTSYRKTKRTVALREIRVVREDGRQTAVLTSLPREEHDPVSVLTLLFDRTGNQENYFKYMREEYRMDAKGVYELKDIADEELTHPNPQYVKLEKQKTALLAERRKILASYAADLVDIAPEQAQEVLAAKGKVKQAENIGKMNRKIDELNELMGQTPCREQVSKAGYKRMNEQVRAFQYGYKMSAQEIENQLVQMLEGHYKNVDKEGHKLIVAALQTSGDIRLEPGEIVVCLKPQSSRIRTRAVNHVLEQLNQRKAVFPGSHRVIRFEKTPEPVPVLHNI